MAASAPEARAGATPKKQSRPARAALTLVTAMAAEARPLQRHYRLNQVAANIWQGSGDRAGMRLLLTGMGAARAAATIRDCGGDSHGAWLNVGIAWHKRLEPGAPALAHSIHDGERSWFPQMTFAPPCACDELFTVKRALPDYQRQGLVDMEAAGFYQQAVKGSTAELVHCLKVVSDNPSRPVTAAEARARAEGWIQDAMPVIDRVCQELLRLSDALASREAAAELPAKMRATVSERRELRLRLRQWRHLLQGQPPPQADSAAELLAKLRQGLLATMRR